jgi:hypothetical protein
MGGRKKSPSGAASPLPLSPQERTRSGAAANSQLCANSRPEHLHKVPARHAYFQADLGNGIG